MAEERNFRVQFYEKVGLRELEERRALEALLREEPVDGRRLSVWCRRCVVPWGWRSLVWRLLLAVTPRHPEAQQYVRLQQTLTYQELWRTVKSLRLHHPPPHVPAHLLHYSDHPRTNGVGDHYASDNPQPHHYVLMWLVSEAKLLHNTRQQLEQQECRQFLAITRRMTSFYQDPVEVLHVSLALFDLIRRNRGIVMEALAEATGHLRRENQTLHQHLLTTGLFSADLLTDVCLGLFYEILPDAAAGKVIDKVVTGAVAVLGCVMVALLLHLRQSLFTVNTVEGVSCIIAHIRPSEAETVVAAALDHWARLGHPRRP
ncbi:hypothetical protein Pmani_018160 [Petrolisthes manimaculis]|uniref:TBC1 domain family member 7 n=1 Tax=Petrolisthes manimaculis TaxID=1843537 RepID=A0AAE1PKZ8_9EUCA|nr:hypothetical protein Pmani_029183 [Petrolisthes manimaculis]KAK4310269.1 hypothetical protein Pmani_018160 [Petrolisthes manimaculis]